MPALRHASMSSVPAGAVSFFPSTVKVTSGIFSLSCLSDCFRKRDGQPLDYILFGFAGRIELVEVDDGGRSSWNRLTGRGSLAEVKLHPFTHVGACIFKGIAKRTTPRHVRSESAPVVCALFVNHEIFARHFSPAF